MTTIKSIVLFTLCTLLLFGVIYPLLVVGAGALMPRRAAGLPIERDGRLVGYENIGQAFSSPRYFWGRPSAVSYNAASTGGSNYGPNNPAFLQEVQARIDTLLHYNPEWKVEEIPMELVTASGSGLDPHISPQAALLQAPRVARARGISQDRLRQLIADHTQGPLWGLLGPAERVNVLQLNLAMDALK